MSRWEYRFFLALLVFIFARLDLIALETVPAPEILSHLNNLRAAGCCFINVFIKHLKFVCPIDQFHKLFIYIDLSKFVHAVTYSWRQLQMGLSSPSKRKRANLFCTGHQDSKLATAL